MDTSRTVLFSSMLLAGSVMAQEPDDEFSSSGEQREPEGDMDEVVVTGSYIRRSQFESSTPVQVITADEIRNSGTAGLGEYIKDLTFMNNINIENDPGDFAGGGDLNRGRPDGISQGFDLRGFGDGGTLTLVDGQRTSTANADANGLVPTIALSRVEVATDGAGAAYGSDAIAGVVNIISIREYDGFKLNMFHQQDGEGSYDENKIEMLTGFTLGEWEFVTTLEATQRSRLALMERPDYARAAQTVSSRGNPGAYYNGAPSSFLSNRYLDPGCGADIADSSLDPGSENFLITGSEVLGDGEQPFRPTCYFGVDVYSDVLPERDRYVWNTYSTYEISDGMTLKLDGSFSWTDSKTRDYPPVAIGTGTTSGLIEFPREHPAFQSEPFASLPGDDPFVANGSSWRPFGRFGTLPPGAGADGSMPFVETTFRQRYSARLESELGDTSWENFTNVNYSESRQNNEEVVLLTDRLEAAARGEGGPGGDEWFNPLLSSVTDPALANSRELVDWMFEDVNYAYARTEQFSVETRFSGDLYELPTGMIQSAFGVQYQDYQLQTSADPYAAEGNRYGTSGAFGFGVERTEIGAFYEFGIPIFQGLEVFGLNVGNASFDVSGRKEWNEGRQDTPLTPKYALRWSPTDDWALRVSHSTSSRAPSASNITLEPDPEPNEFPQTSTDPFAEANPEIPPLFGTDAVYFTNGNPDLESARSRTINLGFSYRGFENLTLSMDAQEIKNYDRIETLGSSEILGRQFAQFEAQGGDPQDLNQVRAFFEANPHPRVERHPETGGVLTLLRYPTNTGERISRTVDATANYGRSFDNLGFITARLNTTYIDRFELIPEASLDGSLVNFVGRRNEGISGAPTLPRWRANLRLGWSRNQHDVSLTANYTHDYVFDGDDIIDDRFDTGLVAPDRIDAITRVDLRYGYAFSDLPFFEGDGRVTFGSRDLFDEKAQIVPVRQGKVSEQTITGRTLYMEMEYNFVGM